MERDRIFFSSSSFSLKDDTHQRVIGGCPQRHEETRDFLSAGAGGLGVSLRVTVTACARGHALPTCPPARQAPPQARAARTTSTDSASRGLALNVSYFITVRCPLIIYEEQIKYSSRPVVPVFGKEPLFPV